MNDTTSVGESLSHNSVVELSVLVRMLTFSFPRMEQPRVTVRIWYDRDQIDSPFRYETSHYCHTPLQAGPYISSAPWRSTEEDAIAAAVSSIGTMIASAIEQGYEPDPAWLVPNTSWTP